MWGVEERYAKRIRDVVPGDMLVFALGREFRSVHEIVSKPFRDDQPLWPEKDGSIFPHRVKISDPLFKGKASIKDLAVYRAGVGQFHCRRSHLDEPDANSLLDLLRRMAG